MSSLSVDELQKILTTTVFKNRQDSKKASGRALGTIVELITFYILKEWEFLPHLSIERGLNEFGNDKIIHNVEFGLHQLVNEQTLSIGNEVKLPLTSTKLLKLFEVPDNIEKRSNYLLTSDSILRNSCLIGEYKDSLFIANLKDFNSQSKSATLSQLKTVPFSMVECKRVGVEDGVRKGPTTIEKAKQGAYVATRVSSLQKIRNRNGEMFGIIPLKNGKFKICELISERKRIIYDSPQDALDGFILTIGVVSNHGNWFTKDNMNKELLVLK